MGSSFIQLSIIRKMAVYLICVNYKQIWSWGSLYTLYNHIGTFGYLSAMNIFLFLLFTTSYTEWYRDLPVTGLASSSTLSNDSSPVFGCGGALWQDFDLSFFANTRVVTHTRKNTKASFIVASVQREKLIHWDTATLHIVTAILDFNV